VRIAGIHGSGHDGPDGGAAASGSSDLELEVVAGDTIGETITVVDELVIGRHVPGLGSLATNDAYHHSQSSPDGEQLACAIRVALDDAGVGPDDVDTVFADATGIPELDLVEAKTLKDTLGKRATRPGQRSSMSSQPRSRASC
jgi:Beta-ketoacyl synthase, C-terminal domain